MLASFFAWWFARLIELLPIAWTGAASGLRDGIVVDAMPDDGISVSLRRNGVLSPIALGAAARQGGRRSVLVRPPTAAVLVKHHVVPTLPARQLGQLLRHELVRITPFAAEDLFWRWDGRTKVGDRTRTEVMLTMVPRAALGPALSALDEVGLKPDFVEVGSAARACLLTIGENADRTSGSQVNRILAVGCAALALVGLALPVGVQAVALYTTEAAIAALQPAVDQVQALRRGIAAGDAGRDILAKEMERTGDVLQTLAVVTRILPDDTYLTDFALRERQMTLSGRSASAPRLITGLSADPAIRDIAFAAPVTRIEGASADVFSIKGEVAK